MKKTLLFLSIIFLSVLGYSQTTLEVDSLTPGNIPDSTNYAITLSHTIIVNISGGASFTGTVYLLAGVDSSAGLNSIDTVAQRAVVNKLNDTIIFTYSETYDGANAYRKGGNVVVIWPVASGLTTVGNYSTDVYVGNAVGINEELALYKAFVVYPNPSQDYILVKNVDEKQKVNRVTMRDIQGRLVYAGKLEPRIDITKLNSGMYFLKFELNSGKILNYKIIKE